MENVSLVHAIEAFCSIISDLKSEISERDRQLERERRLFEEAMFAFDELGRKVEKSRVSLENALIREWDLSNKYRILLAEFDAFRKAEARSDADFRIR